MYANAPRRRDGGSSARARFARAFASVVDATGARARGVGIRALIISYDISHRASRDIRIDDDGASRGGGWLVD